MTDTISAPNGTNLLQTVLAKPWHYRRNGRYYLRVRPKSDTTNYFTVSLRTADRSAAMDISKDIMKALAVFHLDNPTATWEDLRPRLLTIAEECLTMAHGDDSLVAYAVVYDEIKDSLSRAAAHGPFTAPQQRAIGFGKRIMSGAQDRLRGDAEPLIGIVRELEAPERPSLSSSVSAPEAPPKDALTWDYLTTSYMKEHSSNIKESTKASMETNFKVIGLSMEAIGLTDLRTHTRADMIDLRTDLLRTRKASTVNNLLIKLMQVLDWAVANDHLTKAYTTKLKISKGADSDREAFSRDQVVTVMKHAATLPMDSWERWGVSLLAITGARVGEVAQLTKPDITKVDGYWCININEDSPDKSIKNKHSARVVPLIDGALGFDLQAFLEAVEGGALPSDHGVNPVKASKHLGLLMKKALGENRTENQTLHSLRHHIASSMKSGGVPVAFAQAILGHSTKTIAYDNYGSEIPVEALAEVLKGFLL